VGVRHAVEGGAGREGLQRLLPPGGARNALDCAFWELEAALSGRPVWRLAGLEAVRPLVTTFTAGAGSPEEMVESVQAFPDAKALKLKLTGEVDLDVARVRAVRARRPQAWLGVDANQGYTRESLQEVLPHLVEADVRLVEQPLPRGREAELDGVSSPIPLAADESALSCADLKGLVGRFQVVNIKLDKCGGLTEGLAMAEGARALGLDVMVGNMMGSSLATAPAFLVGQFCQVVDLDGPALLAHDRDPGVAYRDGEIWCGEEVWGGRPDAARRLHGSGRAGEELA
jgi:L-Ala-D/L-Glu epimerase